MKEGERIGGGRSRLRGPGVRCDPVRWIGMDAVCWVGDRESLPSSPAESAGGWSWPRE